MMGELPAAERRWKEAREAEAVELLRAAGYMVRHPGQLHLPVTSHRRGSFDEPPFRIEQVMEVAVGANLLRVRTEYDRVGCSFPPEVLASAIVHKVERAISATVLPAIVAELQWVNDL